MSASLLRSLMCLILFASLNACSKQEAMPAKMREAVETKLIEEVKAPPPQDAPPPPPAGSSTLPVDAQLSSRALSANVGERKFIRTAQVEFRAKDVYVSALGIEDTVASFGGFVTLNSIGTTVRNTQRHPGGDGKVIELSEVAVQGHLIVRVPSHKTQEFLRAIVGHVELLNSRKFSARDAQFDLLRKMLEYARNEETQDELGQAGKDGGKLNQKAAVIASRSDAKAARDAALVERKEFEDEVAFSTIDFNIYQLPKIVKSELTDVDAVFYQNRPGLGGRLVGALRSGWDGMLDLCVGIALLWPLWIVIAFAIALLRRYRKRSLQN
ncbi:MAG: hypothetical protein V4582_20785 [Pseudomonadota bacterium]